LSKDYLDGNAGAEWLPLRNDEFYTEQDIEVLRGREVKHVNVAARTINFTDGEKLSYDANRIMGTFRNAKRAVVVGASFIGMEVAASLTGRGLAVTVVAPGSVPFEKTLGERIGRMFQDLHLENGVTFSLKEKIVRIEGQKRVEGVVLESGERLAADLIIVGLGVKPVTDYVEGISLHEDGGVPVHSSLQAADALFAAGDIAWVPYQPTGELIRVEHWRVAQQQGRMAALAMLGKELPYSGIPFFWTAQFGQRLNYIGQAPKWDEIIFWGDPARRDFIAFYVRGGNVIAIAGINHDTELAIFEDLMRLGQLPPVDAVRDKFEVGELLKRN
jgi:apoptosis-inducing factor 3